MSKKYPLKKFNSQVNQPTIRLTRVERRIILDDFGAPLWLSETVTKIEVTVPRAVKRLRQVRYE